MSPSPRLSTSSSLSARSSCPSLPPAAVPVPWARVLPILFFRIVDALSFSLVFPYIAAYLAHLGVPAADVGLYAGLAEGALMATEAACAAGWARLADRFGRRPCVLAGSVLPVVAMARLGFCTSAGEIVFWRALWGTSPSGTLSRLMIGESTHPTNRARIMSIFAPCFNIGLMSGAFLGGLLAQPHGRLPVWLGGGADLWLQWPFGLPAVAGAALGAASLAVSYFFLVEVSDAQLPHTNGKTRPTTLFKTSNARPSMLAVWKVPSFALLTGVFALYQFITFSYDAIFTVYTYTAVERGGLGLSLPTIGMIYSAFALVYVVMTPLVLPALQARIGPARALTLTLASWPAIICGLSATQALAGADRAAMWVALGLQMGVKDVANMSWSLCDILNTSLFDDAPELFASACAVILIAGASGRAFGPVFAGWLYSQSTATGSTAARHQIPWLVLLVLCFPLVWLALRLRRDVDRRSLGHCADGEDALDEKETASVDAGLLTV